MSNPKQQIRFCTGHDGTSIAYAKSGRGSPIVKAANWLSHLEFDWESPVWSHMMNALSQDHTLLRYDERGCGLSDWNVADLSFEAWVRDLEAVVDAAGIERFVLLGISQGASIAVDYAVRHPDRVSHLVLLGGYARGRLKRVASPALREEAETMNKLAELGWGQQDPAFRLPSSQAISINPRTGVSAASRSGVTVREAPHSPPWPVMRAAPAR